MVDREYPLMDEEGVPMDRDDTLMEWGNALIDGEGVLMNGGSQSWRSGREYLQGYL